jgi:hypothetical protein
MNEITSSLVGESKGVNPPDGSGLAFRVERERRLDGPWIPVSGTSDGLWPTNWGYVLMIPAHQT